jgi:hypothetical protein
MWTNGTYKITFRHLKTYHSLDVVALLIRALDTKQIKTASTKPLWWGKQLLQRCSRVTTAVLWKKITDGELSAWARIATGYAFCSPKDQFSRKEGRNIAVSRLVSQLSDAQQYAIRDLLMDKTA